MLMVLLKVLRRFGPWAFPRLKGEDSSDGSSDGSEMEAEEEICGRGAV